MICCCQTLPAWQQCCMGACKTVSRLLPSETLFQLSWNELAITNYWPEVRSERWFHGPSKSSDSLASAQRHQSKPQMIISSLLVFFGSANILPSWLWVSFLSEKGSRRFWHGRGGRVATHSRRCVGVGGGRHHGIQRSDHWENRS